MSITPNDLRNLITGTLKFYSTTKINLYSEDIRELLMLTAAQESHCGKYLIQINGPAVGIFQIEPATYNDLFDNYLIYNQDLLKIIDTFNLNSEIWLIHLTGNIVYQIIIARLQYRRFKEAVPSAKDIPGLAYYYKKYWNTIKGKATIQEAIDNYNRYAV